MVELSIMKPEKIDKSILLNYTTMRKCVECKEYIQLEKYIKYEKVEDEYIYFKDKLYHSECLKKKLKNKKISKMSDEDIIVLINGLRDESYNHAINLTIKNHFYKYLAEHYSIVMLPTYIFTKMEQIFTGCFRGMNKAIPVTDLFDMFIRKQHFLDNIYHKEKLDGVARINYDTQVLVSKYNDYVNWKEKSKIGNKESEIYSLSNNDEKLTEIIISTNIQNKNNNVEEDIFDE